MSHSALPHTGFGLMGMTACAPSLHLSDEVAFAAMNTALSEGATWWNSGDFYGRVDNRFLNLELLNRYFTAHPSASSAVTLSVKGSVEFPTLQPRGDPEFVKKSVDDILRVLDGKKFIDIFECARVAKDVPIEETIATLAEYVRAGKIGGIGLSEVSAATIRRAHAVHPIAAVEVEVSLWSREIFSNGVADTCRELGIPIVAYSPLGRGMLTGRFNTPEDIPEGDFRRSFDRFKPGAFENNIKVAHKVREVAEKAGVTPAQIALEWVRRQGTDGLKIIPIPGARTAERVKENMKRTNVSDELLEELGRNLKEVEVVGGRYNAHAESALEG